MTIQDIVLSVVPSAVISSALLVIIGWLFRESISAWLKASIQHEYDQKLETHKASLKSQNEASFLELKNALDQRFTLYQAAQTSFAEGQKAAIERKLDSIEKLWNEILRLKNECPPMLAFIDLLSVKEYKDARNHEGFGELATGCSPEKIAEYVGNRDYPVEKVRPYVGEYLWSMFFAYRRIMGRICSLLYWSLEDADKAEWHNDNFIQQILEAVLSKNELTEFESINLCKISWLQQRLESKILAASQKIISGEKLSEESFAQARSILERAAMLDSINRHESSRKS